MLHIGAKLKSFNGGWSKRWSPCPKSVQGGQKGGHMERVTVKIKKETYEYLKQLAKDKQTSIASLMEQKLTGTEDNALLLKRMDARLESLRSFILGYYLLMSDCSKDEAKTAIIKAFRAAGINLMNEDFKKNL